jgi:Arc/MetJ family transcription regulator
MGLMNVTLTLDDALVTEVRKLAAGQGTTLSGLVRDHLERLVAENSTDELRRRQRALEGSFSQFQFMIGERTWSRDDLHDR